MTRRRWRDVDPRLGAGLILLIVLWLAAAGPAVLDATDRVRARNTADRLGHAVDSAVVALQDERRLSTAYLAGGEPAPLLAARARTDRARAELGAVTDGWHGRLYDPAAVRVADDLTANLDLLGVVRSQVNDRVAPRSTVLSTYDAVIDIGLSPSRPLGLARDALSEEDALLRAALTTTAGVTELERLHVGDLAGERHARMADGSVVPGPADQRLSALEDRLMLRRGGTVTPAEWAAAADPVNAGLRAAETQAARDAVAATPGTIGAIVYAGLVAGVGLVALIGVLVMARRFAPTPATAAAPVRAGADAEAGLQALLLDLHRRSQKLVHRLLRLLDGMERRQSDDEMLGELFRADHLATRVRRNVEKAITLAGGAPGRQWREPAPIGEVVRGAAAEVADYVRVSTAQVEAAGLAGDAVTEVTHLLAELIDNAVTYSPAETRVRVGGDRAEDGGYTVTIADAGPGMSDLDLANARQVMDDPEPPGGGVWWGFYAIGRFAARRGIDVRLYRGPSGGLVAEVGLPADLVTDPEPDGPRPGGPPINRVARMRARLGEMSDAETTSVDLPVVGIQRPQ